METKEKAPVKMEKKLINPPKKFKKFKLRVVGYEGKDNKKPKLERDGNKALKTDIVLLQSQADELNVHRANTLIEYKEK